jgi:hypothetical protein
MRLQDSTHSLREISFEPTKHGEIKQLQNVGCISRHDKENNVVLYGKADEVGCDVTIVSVTNQD